jgi:hypothetical protein
LLQAGASAKLSPPNCVKYKIDDQARDELAFHSAGWACENCFDSSQVEHESRIHPACHSPSRWRELAQQRIMIVDGSSLHDPGIHFQTISATLTGFGISPRRAKRSATDCWILMVSSSTGTTL